MMNFTEKQLIGIARNARDDEHNQWLGTDADDDSFHFKISDLADYALRCARRAGIPSDPPPGPWIDGSVRPDCGTEIPAIPPPEAWPEVPIEDVPTNFYRGGKAAETVAGLTHRLPEEEEAKRLVDELTKRWNDMAHGHHSAPQAPCALPTFEEIMAEPVEAVLDTSRPQRPHESLVWAILLAAQVPMALTHIHEIDVAALVENLDALLDIWRARWPEGSEK